jgi:hypothetical protein
MDTDTITKQNASVETSGVTVGTLAPTRATPLEPSQRIFVRFSGPAHVGGGKFHVFAVDEVGTLVTLETPESIYRAIVGYRYGDKMQHAHLGIRRYVRCNFLCRIDTSHQPALLTSVDVIPNRFHMRGTSPLRAAEAVSQGFDLRWNEALSGFEIENFDDAGKNLRVAFVRMDENDMVELLAGMRKAAWGKKTQLVIAGYPVTKVEEGLYKVRPKPNSISDSSLPTTRR